MKRVVGLLLLSAAVLVTLSMTAAAQTIEFTGGTESSYGGAGTGLYSGTLNGTSTSFICDDATHDIQSGDTWNANAWYMNGGSASTQVFTDRNGAFAGPPYETATGDSENGGSMNITQSYSAVAYLADLLLTGQDSSYVNQIQYAIWQILDNPGAAGYVGPGSSVFGPDSGPTDTGYWAYQGYLNDTYTNPYIVFYSPDGNTIFSGPDTGDTPQEFIGLNATPEPASMILLGTLLSLSGWLLGRKRLLA